MVSDKPESETDYKTLGIVFMTLGVSLATTFGVTLGWAFAPTGCALFVVGLAFLQKAGKGE